jgi:hypothetical protein
LHPLVVIGRFVLTFSPFIHFRMATAGSRDVTHCCSCGWAMTTSVWVAQRVIRTTGAVRPRNHSWRCATMRQTSARGSSFLRR